MTKQTMATQTNKTNRLPLLLIFFVVLIDLTSWGMVIPILPTYAQRFKADAVTVGLLLATYSLMQMIFAPLLGRWSDRIGRKPILVVSMLGTALAAILTGSASALPGVGLLLLFVGRIIDGISGGNISTAQSYIADITPPENRAHGLGMLGAAIGLGYTIGPGLSGIISRYYGISTPFFVAAGLALCNMTAMWFFLPETVTAERKQAAREKPGTLTGIFDALRNPQLNGLLVVCFLLSCAGLLYMSMLPLFTQKQLSFTEEKNAYLFAFLGLVATVVQGGLIRPLVKRTGELPILMTGLAVLGISLALVTTAASWQTLYFFTIGLATGTALSNPSVMALISRRSSPEEQGETIGYAASAGSLGRIVGPAWGGFAFKHLGPHSPFFSGTVSCLIALLIVTLLVARTGNAVKAAPAR